MKARLIVKLADLSETWSDDLLTQHVYSLLSGSEESELVGCSIEVIVESLEKEET